MTFITMLFGLFKKKERTVDPMKFLIVGLGNMGYEYDKTRHNIGFDILDNMAEDSETVWAHKKLGDITSIKYRGKKLILLKPSTYVNRSGKAIQYWMQKEKIKSGNLFVIVDDLNLELGKIRIRAKGSNGGHNGLKDIQDHIGTQYARLRFGIGSNFHKGRQVDFVLGKWRADEKNQLDDLIKKSSEAAKAFTYIGIARTMSQHNN